ncbi:conserved hypothetical protein [Microbacterium sp. C448]|uniref:AAA family ATPase n=1 Tax=Microbacterium sp. C448 TaxID=1177594 RepID=UPI0003DE65E7|nr:AAA family ATPase [Microbacterium sp. C448]CDJ99079.1 conserved hypothetical protein [Microbacterium sp. C448]
MRLIEVEFTGYRRLRAAKCNVDGPTIAFIGPNESGKSSILEGLRWLSSEGDVPLDPRSFNRQRPPHSDDIVVGARFRLDASDLASIAELDIDPDVTISKDNLTVLRVSRKASGVQVTGTDLTVNRNPKPFTLARELAESLRGALSSAGEVLDEHEVDRREQMPGTLSTAIARASTEWNSETLDVLEGELTSLKAFGADVFGIPGRATGLAALRTAIGKTAEATQTALVAARKASPDAAIRRTLLARAPKFLLFTDEDREIRERYNLADDATRANPGSPFRNLLAIAGTSVDELWQAISSGAPARMRSLERRLNASLSERLQPSWSQAALAVELAINEGGLVEVNINEVDSADYTVTPISERSDGLRTFLGLVCFLIARDLDVPPVLMIDEAERNLHYDAQADLVRVLTDELDVHKVIYTTHSPGCLPLDLGTGIRVVRRDRSDRGVSTLTNTFWTDSEPGFSHLLFAMGAEAAAFSAFRRAVLAEGVSEMILLPTLLRLADSDRPLDFQIAFGLSNIPIAQAMHSVALITCFLVDGDSSGDARKKQLLRAGVPKSHVFQLPKGKAIEDLVERVQYLEVVNAYLAEIHVAPIRDSDLRADQTIAKSVDMFVATHRGMPGGIGHKIIATKLAALGGDLRLAPRSKAV